MKRKKAELWPGLFTIVLASIIFSFAFASCAILQNQSGYEKYTKNTIHRIQPEKKAKTAVFKKSTVKKHFHKKRSK